MERNTALAALDVLVGRWTLTLSDAWFLDEGRAVQHGEAVFSWIDDSFVRMLGAMEGEPTWDLVFGRSDAHEQLHALYHDPRGTSRLFAVTFGDGSWTMTREDPDFHQRFIGVLEGADRIAGRWEASDDQGATWRKDFDLTFERV